jgi:integrase/recombinase XerD
MMTLAFRRVPIQRWQGHSDVTITLRYIAVADMRSEKTRSQVNGTFAGWAFGGAA